MSDLKNKVQGMEANLSARNIADFTNPTDNIYKSLAIISKRARQLNIEMKIELHKKLEEFAVATETIEEVHENKEQIEISKFYERLPNPTVIAFNEFVGEELDYTDGIIEEA